MEYKTLNNGISMPMVGLGVYNISERKTQKVVEEAIATGYRSIDTAAYYDNEQGVGDAVRACGVPRESLFITTKICDSCYTHDQTFRSIDHSMKELGPDAPALADGQSQSDVADAGEVVQKRCLPCHRRVELLSTPSH